MKTLTYKGYQASVEFEDGALFVKVLHLDDLLIGECDAASDAPNVLEELVEAYLADCAEAGRAPSKPFTGSFNISIPSELHRKAAMQAAECGVSLNGWVQQALEEKAEKLGADVGAAV